MQTWGLTDPGNIRQQNQDSYAIVPFARDRVLMIVCDGMGGAKSGNVASSLAVEVFTGEVRRTQKAGMTPEKAAAMLRSALELANRAVYEQSQLSEDFTGMGTTLVAASWRSSSTSATAAPTILPGKTSRSSRATIPWSPTWSSAAS